MSIKQTEVTLKQVIVPKQSEDGFFTSELMLDDAVKATIKQVGSLNKITLRNEYRIFIQSGTDAGGFWQVRYEVNDNLKFSGMVAEQADCWVVTVFAAP